MPKLSVIMAAYNHAAFVREAIDSVLSQSYQDFELVITDDGSSDGTAEVIRGIADPRIHLHAFAENQGACVAINVAITRARGEYVAVLNSDDYFLPGKLQRQVDFLNEHPAIGAVFGLPLFVDEMGEPFRDTGHAFCSIFAETNRSRPEWLRHLFYQGNCLCHPTIMLRKSCYAKVGRFDPLLMQLPDLDLWVRLCKEYDIHILPEKVTAFRILRHEQNVSAPSKEKLARVAWETVAVLERFASFPEEEIRKMLPAADDLHGARIALALEAIKVGRPGYLQFGLGLLRNCMRENPCSFSCAEYFRLVGDTDPFAMQFSGGEYRFIKHSRILAVARKLVRWWHSRGS